MIDLHRYQILAVRWCEYACGGSRGRPEHGDPVYDAVTEGRDFGRGYSSCGDLAHWMLYRCGVRAPWLNRDEHEGWRTGVNVSRLCGAVRYARPPADVVLSPGDITIVYNKPSGSDAHVSVVIDHDVAGGSLQTADYGQPGGALCTRSVTRSLGHTTIGSRRLQHVLRLEDVLRAGPLVGAEDPPEGWR
jgi:hypothetical protein